MQGRKWRISTQINGEWVPFAGAREESMSISPRSIDRTGKERDGFRHIETLLGGECNLQLSGVAVVGPALAALQAAQVNKTPLLLLANTVGAALIGRFIADGYSETAPSGQVVQFSTSFKSTGPYSHLIGPDGDILVATSAFHQVIQYDLYNALG